MKRKTFNKQSIMFYFLKIPNIQVNFAEMNANLIVIRVTFAKSGSTMTATNCPKKGSSAKFRQSKSFFLEMRGVLRLKNKT